MARRKLTEAQVEILDLLRRWSASTPATTEWIAWESGYNYRLVLRSLHRLAELGLATRSVEHPEAQEGNLRTPKVLLWAATPLELIDEAERSRRVKQLSGRLADLDRMRGELEAEISALLSP